jgi:hypothetical protein
VVSKVGAARAGCEMPFCSKLIINLMNHKKLKISAIRILIVAGHARREGRGLSALIMQIIYLDHALSDF